jgi:hypothetical protein
MKKCKRIFSVCTAFALSVLVLSSCSSETEEINNLDLSEVKTVSLELTYGSPETRSGVNPTTPVLAVPVEVGSSGGFIFFTNGYQITKAVEVITIDKESAYEASSDEIEFNTYIKYNSLTSTGCQLTNVPVSSTNCYIYLNLPDQLVSKIKLTALPRSAFQVTQNEILTTKDFWDGAGRVDNTPICNSGYLGAEILPNQMEDDRLEVAVTLAPMIARIEIEGITLQMDDVISPIKSYKLLGIFINNYYHEMSLKGEFGSLPKEAHALADFLDVEIEDNDVVRFWNNIDNKGDYLYTATKAGIGIRTGGVTKAYEGESPTMHWGYNVFPTIADQQPHITLQLSVTYGTSAEEGTTFLQFATVTQLANNENVAYDIERGKVYKISAADFYITPANLTMLPEDTANPVLVKATVTNWSVVNDVHPKF